MSVSNDEILEALRRIQNVLDQLAARVFQAKTAEELLPTWSCGHRHESRRDALACLARGGAKVVAEKRSDNLWAASDVGAVAD